MIVTITVPLNNGLINLAIILYYWQASTASHSIIAEKDRANKFITANKSSKGANDYKLWSGCDQY